MKRDLVFQLEQWKTHPYRVPLILRGARQVGKTWAVREFGKTFSDFVEINFEKMVNIHSLLAGDLDVNKVLDKLSFYIGKKIIPGQTLLFFDEVQECIDALRILRYFKEECPALHVIAAGSLIDFCLEKIGMPVGRVQFMYLYPLSFGEFLEANDRSDLREYAKRSQIEPALHFKLLEYVKEYMWLGGMPLAVESWLSHRNVTLSQEMQDRIIYVYKQDFEKYAKKNQIEFVDKVFDAIPNQLGNKFKYTNIDPDIKVYHLKQALSLLVKAGIAYYCYHSSGQGLPLGAEKSEKKFKIFFFDIGLAQRILGLDLKHWVQGSLSISFLGAIAEQFVAQEYIAYSFINRPPQIYYWHKESAKSQAEVDFLFVKGSQIIPVEIKSNIKGGMKSLKLFLESHPKCPIGAKISENPHAKYQNLIDIPFYGIESWLEEERA